MSKFPFFWVPPRKVIRIFGCKKFGLNSGINYTKTMKYEEKN